MASAGLLLNRYVDFHVDEDDDESSSAAAAAAAVQSQGMEGIKAASGCFPALYQVNAAMLCSMKPADAVLPQPPEIATLRLRGSKTPQGPDARALHPTLVACADKSLLVLYTGYYCGPGTSKRGCYLVYDAAAPAARLSTVPPPPADPYLTHGIGFGAVVQLLAAAGPSSSASASASASYLLAELAITPKRESPDDPDTALLLWRSDEQPTPQWVGKEVRLPREVSRVPGSTSSNHIFQADTAFSGPGGCLCWVDLLLGIVVCTDPWDPNPVLRFVPLPDACPAVSVTDYPYRPRAAECRSAACIGGRIKFVDMVGELVPGCYADHFRLTTWTLSPDLSGWQQDGVFPLVDLWATQEYRALNVPQWTPLCPVLSPCEDGVVYALVNDIEERLIRDRRQVVLGTELDFKHQYVLGIDMRRNKIVSTRSGVPPEREVQMITPRLLSVDFCSSLHGGAKDRQREVEESQIGDSGKKMKL